MAELIALLGAPGAGKSTWAERTGLLTVSLDERLQELPAAAVPRVISARLKKVRAALESGRSVVFDSCLTQPSMRRRVLRVAREANANARLVYFNVPLAVCLERQWLRDRQVPEEKIRVLHSRAIVAWRKSTSEGWDNRDVVKEEGVLHSHSGSRRTSRVW